MNLLGIGGHAKVILDVALQSGNAITSVFDDDVSKLGTTFCGFNVDGVIAPSIEGQSIIAVGNNRIRKIISQRLNQSEWITIIHPSAIIASDVKIGIGSVVMAGVILQSGVEVGNHCIVNTGACVDHDCIIGDFAHIAPNVSMAGGIKVGEGSLIGIGSAIIPGIHIGDWSILGAGSVVVKNIPSHQTWVGNPAKSLYE